MIHPTIPLVFHNDESRKLFTLIRKEIKNNYELIEFIKWHLEINKEVINEITNTQKIDFSEKPEAKKWAECFLLNYDVKIRRMRHVSNLIFERFFKLKDKEFGRIISENKEKEEDIVNMMNKFLNKKELLIGKIIFAYREAWFLANQICDHNFKLGSIKTYKKWVKDNFSNIKELDRSLNIIYEEISK